MRFSSTVASKIVALSHHLQKELSELTDINISTIESHLNGLFVSNDFAIDAKQRLAQNGFCLFSSAPIDDVAHIPTPLAEDNKIITPHACMTLMWLFQSIANMRICGVEHVKGGALFHNIVPTHDPTGLSKINDAAWGRQLGFHQEMAFINRNGLQTAPGMLALLCLRGGEGECPTTYVVSVNQIVSVLSNASIRCLQLPIFIIHAPYFIPWVEKCQSLLYFNDKNKMCLTYSSLYTGDHPTIEVNKKACRQFGIEPKEAQIHLQALDAAYDKVKPMNVVFNAGDLLLMDNSVVQHARSLFHPNLSNRKNMRWLLRAYASQEKLPDRLVTMVSRAHTNG